MAPPIRVRIVAAVDASLANVFNSMTTAAKRAGQKMGADLGAGAQAGVAPYRALPEKIKAPLAQAGQAGKQFQQSMGSVADGAKSKFEQLAAELRKMPAELQSVARVAQSELAKIERVQARSALGLSNGPGFWTKHRYATQNGMWSLGIASRIGGGAVNAGVALGADLLHGLGVNTDPTSMFAESQRNEALFRNISSFGYMPGTGGPNAERIDPEVLLREAHKIGQRTGFTANEAGLGLEKFVGLTGDLDLGRKSLEHMAVLSKATGSSLEEMVEAAGAASNTLGNMPNKAEVLYDVMKQVSSEGKTGAILIKDLATQMAKIASSAQMFAGDRSHTIGILGAMAQEARGRGGAASASQAATSVQQFTNVFRKRQRLDTFSGFGIQAYDAGGGIRDPQQLVVESFVAAMKGGFRLTPAGKKLPMAGAIGQHDAGRGWQNFETNLTALYGDVKAMRATAGFESVFKEGYTGTKGTDQEKLAAATAAVNEEFHRLTIDMMDEKTVQEDFKLAMANSKSQVAVFNDQIQETAEQFQKEMLPAVTALAPEMVLLAKGAALAVETLLGVKTKPTGMKGFWEELLGVSGPRITTGTNETAAETARAQATTEASAKALALAAGRSIKSGVATGLPDYAVTGAPGAVSVPAEAPGILDEHAAQLAGAVAAARGRRDQELRGLAGALGLKGDATSEQIAAAAQSKGIDFGKTTAGAAEKELMNAEQALTLARTVGDAVKEGLRSGTLSVSIVEDKTKKQTGPSLDLPTMPAESQP